MHDAAHTGTGRRTDAGRTPRSRTGLPPPLDDMARVMPGEDHDPRDLRALEILSHELRSPITTIHLGTKVLRDGGRRISGPLRTEVVEAVDEEVERLERLVEDLLAIARHDRAGQPLPVRPILLQHWLPDAVGGVVRGAPSLQVRTWIEPLSPPVLADEGALAQVMRNVLANVVRHAPDGMPAEVVAQPAGDGTVRIEVLDRGPGIDAEDAEVVFEPFVRTARADALGSGAGLGLTAARRLLTAMDGTIEVRPRAGGGTGIVIGLPVAVEDVDADQDEADLD